MGLVFRSRTQQHQQKSYSTIFEKKLKMEIRVPFVDLQPQYQKLKTEIDSAIFSTLQESNFIGGYRVTQFENDFAKLIGAKHCIGVANGTDAIYIVLKMLGIGNGDEVITVANSWISTSETITQTGAKPVFVDIDAKTYTINVDLIERAITPNTKAIIPVHLYGHAANLEPIIAICKKYNLCLIEDCAQSHLTKYNNQIVGTFGVASTFSFYPGKNLGAYGDAGAILTNDDELAKKIRMYANHGGLVKHQHEIEGINSRLDTIQAAILQVKLSHLRSWNELRNKHAEFYLEKLKGIGDLVLPYTTANVYHTYHLFVVRTKHRQALQHYLTNRGIQTAIHYPVALPNLPAYAYLQNKEKEFAVATQFQSEILSLPMYADLVEEQLQLVCDNIKAFFKEM
jgi:dTDP-4-amino-4,6-dideoxygalactose transaminase